MSLTSEKFLENKLVKINTNNVVIYINLARAYEAEFSILTKTLPNENGIFEPATLPDDTHVGYLLYRSNIPIGFCIVEISPEINDVSEFYIIPAMRSNKYGYGLAINVFNLHPGKWQVRQIENANNAIAFWRRIIKSITNDNFVEAITKDNVWGMVTRQRFLIPEMSLAFPKHISRAVNNNDQKDRSPLQYTRLGLK